jgi:SAM-dependent methyltransferase
MVIVSTVGRVSDLFGAAAMYDEDYLHFFAAPGGMATFAEHGPVLPGTDVPGEAAADLAWRLGGLRPGMRVLDLACGHGDLASHLAARGCQVTGLDSSEVFLDRARADAAGAGVSVEYVAGDMRELPWTGRFEAERTVVRDGRARRISFVKRLFGFPELRDWLVAAGFAAVAGYGEDAQPLTAAHKRMVIVADLP